jgi:OOP family OmpA-OmpF porin
MQRRSSRALLCLSLPLCAHAAFALEPLPPWEQTQRIERDAPEAELLVQLGDIDNLGFGWPQDFDPFTGRSTPEHAYPWQPEADDPPGTDRIMVPSGWQQAGGDGYTAQTQRPDNRPQALRLAFDPKGITIHAAALQLFVDDFQAPVWEHRFRVTLDGREAPDLALALNALNQTGPIGKLVTLQLLPEYLPLLDDGVLEVSVDDPDRDAADGYAFDFARLLLNPKPWKYAGTVSGIAVRANDGEPLSGVLVSVGNVRQASTDADGRFVLERVPAGLVVASASHPSYLPDSEVADLEAGASVEVTLELSPAPDGSDAIASRLEQEGRVDLYGIYFDTDRDVLKPESEATLQQVRDLLESRPQLGLVVAGHTDAEGGDAHNLALSQRRAAAVIAWLVAHDIDAARLEAEGLGETRPVADNASAAGRALNRRVELRDRAR